MAQLILLHVSFSALNFEISISLSRKFSHFPECPDECILSLRSAVIC